jgi:hypothetical protein
MIWFVLTFHSSNQCNRLHIFSAKSFKFCQHAWTTSKSVWFCAPTTSRLAPDVAVFRIHCATNWFAPVDGHPCVLVCVSYFQFDMLVKRGAFSTTRFDGKRRPYHQRIDRCFDHFVQSDYNLAMHTGLVFLCRIWQKTKGNIIDVDAFL